MNQTISTNGIRNLLIDFGGVLIDLDKTRCVQSFERIGIRGLEHFLQDCHQQGFLNEFERGLITPGQFCQNVRQQMDCTPHTPSDEAILAAWNSFLVGIPSYKLDLLLKLRTQYRLLLLSNTNETHWEWSCGHDFSYQGHRVEDFFHDIYLSFKLHVEKPRPEIFEHIIRDSGILPEETLFIDDSSLNCEIGCGFGLRTYTPQARENWNNALRLIPDFQNTRV